MLYGHAQAKTIKLEVLDDDVKIIENDVVDAEQWVRNAWVGKVNRCKERLIKEEIAISINSGESIPAGDTAIIEKHFSRNGYENRKQRDEREDLNTKGDK
jgi:hypothetical protein